MVVRPLVIGTVTVANTLPARLLRRNGKVVGKMEDTSVIPPSAGYSGCTNKRFCLATCAFPLANRDQRYDYAGIIVSGIVDKTCTGSRVRVSDGWTANETLELTGFAAMNGTYLAPIEDWPWSFTDTVHPCGTRIKPTSWVFTNYQRSYGTLVSPGGGITVPFDVTCEIETTLTIDCGDAGISTPCSYVALFMQSVKKTPTASPNTNPNRILYQTDYNNLTKCTQDGNDAIGLTPVDGTWWDRDGGIFSNYRSCQRPYTECNPESSSGVWTNSSVYGISACCPFSAADYTDTWV